jgi:hypothetical protein
MRSLKPDSALGYKLGLAVGVWFRSVLVAIAGVFALLGYGIAMVLFAAGVLWRALPPGREFVAGFLSGYEESSGQPRPALAAAFGAGWVGITRGVPLLFLYLFSRAA